MNIFYSFNTLILVSFLAFKLLRGLFNAGCWIGDGLSKGINHIVAISKKKTDSRLEKRLSEFKELRQQHKQLNELKAANKAKQRREN
ncbi:hypothetical protein R3X26_18405 [Vibrio sp. TH_r3]|uniref:hypothetical protein n=1 Tax=Vibrio sp. TH_r3 TaxID=3082084 RepID=UPI002953C25B|nr:hypothetical protein [Vibrio sp. TH_r3]MDV7106359.1 hypothetical protein [Vibrio sp. TH_r3]